MKNRRFQILSLFSVLLFTFACQMNLGDSSKPEGEIPISIEAAESVDTTIQSALAQAEQTGAIAFTLSEEQVTSYVAYKLQENGQLKFINPQVYLRDGMIQIYGQVEQEYILTNISISLLAYPDETGDLAVDISKIDLGPIPVSSTISEDIERLVNESLTDMTVSQSSGKLQVESIDISDGMLTLVGQLVK
jgi:hypothetical protein